MAKISEDQAKNHRHQVPYRNQRPNSHLIEGLHGQQAGDHVNLDGNDSHSDRVIQDNNAPFALGLHHIHPQEPNHHLAHPPFCHRARKHAPHRRDHGDHCNRHQDQTLGGAKQVVETLFDECKHYDYPFSTQSSAKDTIIEMIMSKGLLFSAPGIDRLSYRRQQRGARNWRNPKH